MPICDFDEVTFVSFVDISGFKELMKNRNEAESCLDWFYTESYKCINAINNNERSESRLEGLLISDCGIFIVRTRNQTGNQNHEGHLKLILLLIRDINKKMLERNVMVTSSIAYGEFKFHNRYEGLHTIKAPIYGKAYVKAFFDNENGKPKIQPGQCRILKDNLPDRIKEILGCTNHRDEILSLVKRRVNDVKRFYFYWMVNNPSEIDEFEKDYTNAYNLKYAGMLRALKRDIHQFH
jgi:hypothetical protein